jgi:hypothetical protein
LICCVALLFLVISGKRRAWWLIGLGPVVALFVHRFATAQENYFSIADEPQLVSVDHAGFLHDEDWVVGIDLDDDAFAYPYQAIYSTPVVLQSDREKRVLLMWSPFANAAKAFLVDHEIKGRELDIVSMPANALLVYNSRNGQFINGLTGQTTRGQPPAGFTVEFPTHKTTWKLWRDAHPNTQVMQPPANLSANLPAAPVLPLYPMPPLQSPMRLDLPASTRIAIVPTTQPIAFRAEQITSTPQNVMAGKTPLLIFRDPATAELHIFDRRIDEDLMPRFELNHNARRKDVAFIDADTKTGWSWAGIAVDGNKDYKGKKLKPIAVQQDLYWGVMKFWYPDLEFVKE